MRVIYIIVFLFSYLTACSQQEVKIIKECYFSGNESFPNRKYICQKMYFQGKQLMSKIEYSYNGWQVYDFTSYKYIKDGYITELYKPIYDLESRIFKGYELESTDTVQHKILSGKLVKINDQYHLSKPYLYDLWFLLERNPKNENNIFKFKYGIIPTLFSEYGLPYNELLKSFTFTISQDNLIEGDVFFFQDYIVRRKYKYNEYHRLKEVQITIENTKDNIISEYRESFEIIN